MAYGDEPRPQDADILIAGAGLAGLTAAFGLAKAGFAVVSSGPSERSGSGRTVALLDRSVAILEALGLWAAVRTQAAPLRGLRLIDASAGLFPARPVEFHASEIGLDAFGWNIENARMAEALAAAIAKAPHVERTLASVETYDFGPEVVDARLVDGRLIRAPLAIGADGRLSKARRAAGLEARLHRYPQAALTALLAHRLPHNDFSTEFHTRGGPFTLVPLPASGPAENRSSLVWVMADKDALRLESLDDDALAREIERQAHSLLGAMRIEGGRGFFPLARQVVPRIAGPRLALIGDAGHVLPPIGAQGLNLGLRDVEAIIACAAQARADRRDIGAPDVLAAYERARRADILVRTSAVDGLNRSLIAHFGAIDFARGAALSALSAVGPLRRLVMRHGVGPRFTGRLPGS